MILEENPARQVLLWLSCYTSQHSLHGGPGRWGEKYAGPTASWWCWEQHVRVNTLAAQFHDCSPSEGPLTARPALFYLGWLGSVRHSPHFQDAYHGRTRPDHRVIRWRPRQPHGVTKTQNQWSVEPAKLLSRPSCEMCLKALNLSSFRWDGSFAVCLSACIDAPWLIYLSAWLLKAFDFVTPLGMVV